MKTKIPKPIYCENCEKELTELDKETHTNWCDDCLDPEGDQYA